MELLGFRLFRALWKTRLLLLNSKSTGMLMGLVEEHQVLKAPE